MIAACVTYVRLAFVHFFLLWLGSWCFRSRYVGDSVALVYSIDILLVYSGSRSVTTTLASLYVLPGIDG